MSDTRAGLERECRTFTRYLVRRDPTPYVTGKYCDAHVASAAFTGDRFDHRLTAVARLHPIVTFIADAYARFFVPRGGFRKKLILLLAILETCPPFYRAMEQAADGRLLGQVIHVGARLLLFVPAAIVGAVLFVPLRLVSR